jgi:hypothetical protein
MRTHYLSPLIASFLSIVLLTGCGGSSSSVSDKPPQQSCGSWPVQLQPLAASTGNSSFTQVIFKDSCTLWVAGYYGSSHYSDAQGNSTGFVAQLHLNSQNQVQTQWSYLLNTVGTDRIDVLQRQGSDLIFAGSSDDAINGAVNAGKADVVMGRLSQEGQLKTLSQFGSERPDRITAVLPLANQQWMLFGYTDVYVPTNYVAAWEDGLQILVKEQQNQFSLSQLRLTNSQEPDRYLHALQDPANPDLFWVSRHQYSGTQQGILVEQLNSAGQLLWRTHLSGQGLDQVAALYLQDQQLVVAGSTYMQLGNQKFGDADVFVARLAPHSGDVLDLQQYGTAGTDWVTHWTLQGSSLLLSGDWQLVDEPAPSSNLPFVFRLTGQQQQLDLLQSSGEHYSLAIHSLNNKVAVAGHRLEQSQSHASLYFY